MNPKDGNLSQSLPGDSEWIKSTERLEGKIARGIVVLSAIGACTYATFALIALLVNYGVGESPKMSLSIDHANGIAALGIFLAASTLLTPIAFSLENRMREHRDKRSAQFARPISSAAIVIGIFSSATASALVISSAPSELNVPTFSATVVITGFISLLSSLTVEALRSGSNSKALDTRVGGSHRRLDGEMQHST